MLRDGDDAALRPRFEHGGEQRATVGKSAVEAALGDAQILGQDFDEHLFDAAARQGIEPRIDPLCAPVVLGHRVGRPVDTPPY